MNRDPLAIEMEGLRAAVEKIIIERDELKHRIDKLMGLAAGFMSESNHALFVDAANTLAKP